MSAELVTKIKDLEHWSTFKEANEKKLLVVDVHKDWCGPCKVMEPTYKRLMLEIERADQRLVFASLNYAIGVEGIVDNGSCKPRFLLFREKKQLNTELLGANPPGLENLIKQHLPVLANTDDDA